MLRYVRNIYKMNGSSYLNETSIKFIYSQNIIDYMVLEKEENIDAELYYLSSHNYLKFKMSKT